jgi:hypothetical protein
VQESAEPQPDRHARAANRHRRTLLEAAGRQDWKAVCLHVQGLDPANLGMPVLSASIYAATIERNPLALRKAASLAAKASLAPKARVQLAMRLADASEPLLALAVLVADPEVFRHRGVVSQNRSNLGRALRNIGNKLRAVEPALHDGVLTLARRLLNETAQPALPSPFSFTASLEG